MSTFTIRVTSSAVNVAGTGFGQQPDLGAPSYMDMVVTNSTDPLLSNGTYDVWCLNPLQSIFFSPTTHSAQNLAGNSETAFDPLGMSSITQTQLDQLNWLLSQNFTSDAKYAGGYNYGEVQIAIWKILGFTDAQIAAIDARFLNDNNRNTVVSTEAEFLVSAAQAAVASGNGVLPTNAWFTAIIDPAGNTQPLIVQLQSAKLGNFVWLDTDADGIQDAGEAGVDNVIVELYDGNGNLISTTLTGDDYSTAAVEQGYYQFTGLAAGNYQVKFIPAGDLQITTANANGNGQDAADSDADVVTGLSQIVSLAAGESNQTIDAGLIQPARLSGYVYEDLGNDGVRDPSAPIAGVTITLTGTNDLGQAVNLTTTTNAAGYYEFANLRPGTYQVNETQPAGYLDGKDTAGTTGGTVTNDQLAGIPLAAGQHSQENNFGELKPASLSGYVYEDAGNDGVRNSEPAIAGVTITLTGIDDLGQVVNLTTTTNAAGFYQFTDLRPGSYTVTETQPGGYVDGKDTAGSTGGNASVNDVISAIPLSAGQNSVENNFGELPAATAKLSGYVYEDLGNDGVRDPSAPIAGVTITLTGTNDLGQAVNLTTTTDANGYYEFGSLRAGTYQVNETQPAGYLDGKDTAGTTGGTVTNDQLAGIPLATGQHSQENNFGELKPAKLSGYVYEDAGNDGVRNSEPAIAGVTITLTGTDDQGQAVSLTTTTNAAGYYEFADLRPGTYQVNETQPAGYVDGKDTAGSTGGTVTNDQLANIPLAAGQHSQENNFGELPAATAKLSGYVYEDLGNDGVRDPSAPIAGVTITLTGTNDLGQAVNLTTTTDANGYYEFGSLRAGTYQVNETQPAGYLDGKDTAGTTGGTVSNDQLASIPLATGQHSQENNFGELRPASLSGYVYQDAGNDGVRNSEPAIAGVTITLTGTNDLGQSVSLTTTTNAAGFYQFTDLRPGSYTVTETQPGGYVDGKDTAGSTGGNASVNDVISAIPLSAGQNSVENNFGELPQATAKISGYVYEDLGDDGVRDPSTPIAGVTIKLTGINDLGQAVNLTTTTSAAGYYEFGSLRAGTYQVNETQPGGYLDGKDTAGTTGGTVSNDQLASIPLATGQHSQENNFGELKPAAIGNKVWLDCDMDGKQDAGEPGVGGVTVKLLDSSGNVVGTTTTNANGDYQFTGLRPGSYSVEFVKLTGYSFTTRDAAADDIDSDANVTTGRTVTTFLDSGETDLTWDAGLTAPKQCLEFDFSGNTGVSGAYGNMRTYTNNGVSVNVTAFSRDKASGAFATAYLGAYGGGLGVTDRSESGSGDTHTVDNLGGRDNYVMFTFNQTVTLDSAYLGYVVGDSDIQVWIGNFAGAFNTPLSLSSSVLSSMGFTEINATGSTGARLADLNAGQYAGNVIIIAADSTDGSPDDRFKIDKLDVCTNPCAPPAPVTGSISNFVWHDLNANGIQESGESGIKGVTVKLYNGAGALVGTTVTSSTGEYKFSNLAAGNYKVQVVTPSGYTVTKQNAGSNDAVDSDIASNGYTATINLSAGENDTSVDAGLYKKACIGDRVWEDMDHDGIQDSGEKGIGGITVWLIDGNGNWLQSTKTDSNGNYSFTVDPGTYYLAFNKENVWHKSGWGGTYNMSTWNWGKKDIGSNDSVDSDVTQWDSGANKHWAYTAKTTLVSGENDKSWDAAITPIVIDLNGDGVQTIARADAGGTFDLLGNGKAIASGWVSAQDGLLAVDRNGNGSIDSIAELFGGIAKGAGFASLAAFDSNGDGVVDVRDANFADLRIWQDANGNHATDEGELMTLARAGVASLQVGYVELPFLDGQGNLHLERSSATLADGSTVDMTDVYFNVSMEDVAAAGVSMPSMADLLAGDSLDSILGGAQAASTPEADPTTAQADVAEMLRRLASLQAEQAQPAMAA